MLQNSPSIESDPRWQVLVERTKEATPSFYYGVKSTGIYCRPGCASRQPKPENVVFFDNPSEAEGAGFRACKRCKPSENDPAAQDIERIARACRRLLTDEKAPRLAELAEDAGLSPTHFQKLFKARVGVTPKQFAQQQKTRRFQEALSGDNSVTEAIYEAGYGSSSRAYEKSLSKLGMNPRDYKDGGSGQRISHGCTRCFLGWVLVAKTDKGICAIEFGDDPKQLVLDLGKRFPEARLFQADETFTETLETVIDFLDQPNRALSLPLDIQGTAFQQQVWQALRTIPLGQTASYKEIAEAMGRPSAARAVARACASNPLAVAIPCHRVVRGDGDLSGYRWGVERKKELLDREATATSAGRNEG
ncbi:MAG: bifunctional DNA-binding transcriptional regulator/O6-methylguanine-DNA methyltransferase Ada [Pseudomonadota bacterium]